MVEKPPIAFASTPAPPALEVRINFGLFAGRQATPMELEHLGTAVLPDLGKVTILAEERYEMDAASRVSLHQVRSEVPAEALPADEPGRDALRERLVETAAVWADACIAERAVGETLSERLARDVAE